MIVRQKIQQLCELMPIDYGTISLVVLIAMFPLQALAASSNLRVEATGVSLNDTFELYKSFGE